MTPSDKVYGLMAVLIAIYVIGGLFLVWRAPEGWEDEDGFHYGQPDDQD